MACSGAKRNPFSRVISLAACDTSFSLLFPPSHFPLFPVCAPTTTTTTTTTTISAISPPLTTSVIVIPDLHFTLLDIDHHEILFVLGPSGRASC